jgi:hypothetical protein
VCGLVVVAVRRHGPAALVPRREIERPDLGSEEGLALRAQLLTRSPPDKRALSQVQPALALKGLDDALELLGVGERLVDEAHGRQLERLVRRLLEGDAAVAQVPLALRGRVKKKKWGRGARFRDERGPRGRRARGARARARP